MKKVMIALLILSSSMAFAQKSEFGLKGGLNYGSTGDIAFLNVIDSAQESIDPSNKAGFHLGAYGQFKLLGIFIQPEVVYTQLNTEYSDGGLSADYNVSKIDIPLLVGLNVAGPLNIKAGPSFQYVLNNDLEGDTIVEVGDVENSFTLGYQLGAGVKLGQLGIDLRYESAFQENNALAEQAQAEAQTDFAVDSRPSQWILSLSYAFDSKGK